MMPSIEVTLILFKNQLDLKKLSKQAISAFIDQIILVKLRNDPMTGHDLINYVQEKYGVLVSPGIIYSHLYRFERDNIVYALQSTPKRIYKLTDNGKYYLHILSELYKKTVKILKQEFKLETEKR